MKPTNPDDVTTEPASKLIDQRIAELARLRALIHEADPEVVEEWKWGIPVWSHSGILCTSETYTKAVKLTRQRLSVHPDDQTLLYLRRLWVARVLFAFWLRRWRKPQGPYPPAIPSSSSSSRASSERRRGCWKRRSSVMA